MEGKRFNPDYAHVLKSTERRELLPPLDVIKYLQLRSSDLVADLGAGNGYFTLPIAKEAKQKVYVVDIEPKMLDLLKQEANLEKPSNIRYIMSDLDQIKLDSNSVDKVIIAFVIHEVPDRSQSLREVKRGLKANEEFVLVEWEAVETEAGPPLHEKIPSSEMAEIIKEQGFKIKEEVSLNAANDPIKVSLNEGYSAVIKLKELMVCFIIQLKRISL